MQNLINNEDSRIKHIGKKAFNLQKLEKLGFNVPTFFVFSKHTIERINTDDNLYQSISNAFLSKGLKLPLKVSIRSSGSISAPGRMKTILDVSTDKESLIKAFREVEQSTQNPRLLKYLETKGVEDFSYSIIVQEMVYGNLNDLSCSGVLITENPYSKNEEYYAEVVFKSLGDTLMDGSTTPSYLDSLNKINPIGKNKLDNLVWEVKKHFKEIQEVEFVIVNSQIHILQTRDYKRSSKVMKNSITNLRFIGQGKSVLPLTCIGKVTFDKDIRSPEYILIIDTTDFEDTEAMLNFAGVITRRGGRLSHASMIANEFEFPCVVGAKFEAEPKEGNIILFDENGTIFFVK